MRPHIKWVCVSMHRLIYSLYHPQRLLVICKLLEQILSKGMSPQQNFYGNFHCSHCWHFYMHSTHFMQVVMIIVGICSLWSWRRIIVLLRQLADFFLCIYFQHCFVRITTHSSEFMLWDDSWKLAAEACYTLLQKCVSFGIFHPAASNIQLKKFYLNLLWSTWSQH